MESSARFGGHCTGTRLPNGVVVPPGVQVDELHQQPVWATEPHLPHCGLLEFKSTSYTASDLLYCKSVKKTYTFSPSPDWVRTRSGLGPDSPEPAGICKNQQKMNTTTEIITHVRTRVRTRNTEKVGKPREKLQSVRTPRLAFKI